MLLLLYCRNDWSWGQPFSQHQIVFNLSAPRLLNSKMDLLFSFVMERELPSSKMLQATLSDLLFGQPFVVALPSGAALRSLHAPPGRPSAQRFTTDSVRA